jgi:formylglycine-generating enzyme required for sulfatase activity
MTPSRLYHGFRWLSLLLIPAFMSAACGLQVTGTPTSAPTSAPVATTLAQGILYQEDFTDPASGWPVETGDTFKIGYHPPDFYHLEVSAPDNSETVFEGEEFGDFTVETEVVVDHTSDQTPNGVFWYGLAVRGSSNQYYAFTIFPRTQAWQVYKVSTAGSVVLAQGTDDSIQGMAARDHLRVDAKGSDFVFHINDRTVTQLQDADYGDGEVGFVVHTENEPLAHIHFDSLIIREVDTTATTTPLPQGVLYQDDFTDPESGWPAETAEARKVGYHPPDFYHVEVSAPDHSEAVFEGKAFDDFTVETDVLVDHTSDQAPNGVFWYGLAVRGQADQFYAFTIFPRAQAWQVSKYSAAGPVVLAEGNADSIQGMTARDKLRVDAQGPKFVFQINDRVVATFADADYGSGEIGFVVQTEDEPLAHIHFDSLTIREVDQAAIAQAPTLTPPPPTPTLPPTETPAPLATATPTTAPPPEGMVLVPAGEFLMGSAIGPANERPEHLVQLDAFYLDVHEVTNAAYRECVEAGGCSGGGGARLNNPTYESHPVVLVNWDQAKAYCEWAAKRLPSEAEWEYAASGAENSTWPWGNDFEPVRSAASAPDVQPVGRYPDGASPFGVEDLAGNVAEWVADAYDPNFYASSPTSNPLSATGNSRIYRGGSYGNTDGAFYTTSRRYIKARLFSDVDIGFRCAADLP